MNRPTSVGRVSWRPRSRATGARTSGCLPIRSCSFAWRRGDRASLQTYDPSRSYDAWLTAIANRRAIDALRSRGRRDSRELHDDIAFDNHADSDDASAATEQLQRAQRLREAIAELPPGQREAVEQMGLHERSLSEAAELTGRNTGALKVNLHRALKALRERFNGEP